MILRILVLFVPYILSIFLNETPEISYIVAWLGSFFIYWVTLSGFVKTFQYNIFNYPMRPIVVTHFIFTGYMCVTSIFYYLSSTGYYYFVRDEHALIDYSLLLRIAQCQQYYVLGHAGFAIGIIIPIFSDKKSQYAIRVKSISSFMVYVSLVFLVFANIVRFLPGLEQMQLIFSGLSVVASVISLSYAIPEGKFWPILVSGFFFVSNEINALISGWKEEVIIPIILLATYLYPNYKKTVLALLPVVFTMYFYFIPTYNSIVRDLSWSDNTSGEHAAKIAVERIQKGEDDLAKNNWLFLTERLSEIKMFTVYVQNMQEREYFGLQIFWQALISIVPRVFYPEKPITEQLVMQRVYDFGVISELSNASAKPPPIVDGYLSYGAVGAFITCLFLGFFANWASRTSEALFGDYLIGSGLIYTGLFQTLWRGNCFEFMANNLFWGTAVMYFLFFLGRKLQIIRKIGA